MVEEFSSVAVDGRYPLWFNKGPYEGQLTADEELIVERCRQKILARIDDDSMSPRERLAKNYYTGQSI
jgi:hypothetical protein